MMAGYSRSHFTDSRPRDGLTASQNYNGACTCLARLHIAQLDINPEGIVRLF
jgi:hypothetical protein